MVFSEKVAVALGWTVAGLTAAVPFLYPLHPAPRANFYSEWIALALGAIALLALLAPRFWHAPRIPTVAFYLLAFAGLIGLQAQLLETAYAQDSLMPALFLAWAALLATLGYWVKTQLGLDRSVSIFAWLVLMGGLLSAATGLIQYLDGPGPLARFVAQNLHPGVVYGNIAQRNHLAGQLTLAVIAVAYLFARGRLSLGSALLFTSLLSFVATLTTSRSVFLYAISILLVASIGRKKSPGEAWIRMAWVGGAFAITVLCLQPVLPQLSAWLHADPSSLTTLQRVYDTLGIELRLLEWQKAAHMFIEHPLIGVGVGNYSWYSFLYRATLPEFAPLNAEWFSHAHNIFFQVAAEAGTAGLVILLGLVLTWLRQFWRQPWSLEHGFGAAFLGVVFIHSNLEFPLWHAYFLGPTVLVLGLFDTRSVALRITPRLGQAAVAGCLTLAVVALLMTLQGYQTLGRAIYGNPGIQETAHLITTASANPLLRPYAELVLTVVMPVNRDNIDQKVEVSRRVFQHFPDARRSFQQITLLALADRDEEARKLLQLAVTAYPDHLERFIGETGRLSEPKLINLLEEARNLHQRSHPR